MAKTRRRKPIIKIIKQTTKLNIREFCEKELKTQYPAFSVRLKNGKLYPSEIFYLVWRTGKSIDELFGKPWHELLITDQGGPIVSEILGIIKKLTPEETKNLELLLGFDKNKEQAAKRKVVPNKKEPIAAHPIVPEEAFDEGVNPLEKIFKSTY